jgi:hypothetical protein
MASTSRSPTPRRKDSRRLPPPADAEERRALHHARTQDLRGQGALGQRTRHWRGKVPVGRTVARRPGDPHAGAATHRPRHRAARRPDRLRRRRRAPRLPPAGVLRRSRDRRSRAVGIRWSKGQVDSFIANDTRLMPARRMLLITGPNMGGKSTYMRQAALIVLLAHCGSFVRPRRAAGWVRSTRSTRASAPRTTSPPAARPSWSR